MITIAEMDDSLDTFLPVADELILNISEHKDQIIQLMDMLPTVWSVQNAEKEANSKTHSFFGKALKMSFELCKNTGAKLIIF